MPAPRPNPRQLLGALALGLVLGGAGGETLSLLGAAPGVGGAFSVASLLSWSLAVARTRTERSQPGPGRLAARILGALGVVASLPLLVGALGATGLVSPPALVAATSAVVALGLHGIFCSGAPSLAGGGPRALGGLATGLALGLAAPGLIAIAVGACALAWAAAPAEGRPADDGWGLADLVPIAATTAAALGIATAARALVAPAPDGWLTALIGLFFGGVFGRAAAPRPAAARVALGGLAIAGQYAVLWALPSVARDLALALPVVSDAPATELLILPLACGGLGGVGVGLAAGRRARPTHPIALAAGILLWLSVSTTSALPLLLAGMAAAALLGSGAAAQRAVGGALATLAAALWLLAPPLDVDARATGAWRVMRGEADVERDAAARALQAPLYAGQAAGQLAAVRRIDAGPDAETRAWLTEQDGLLAHRSGRAVEAERMLGLLAGTLRGAYPPDSVLLLGDDAGTVLQTLIATRPGQVTVAVPAPSVVQAAAAYDPAARADWLHPSVRLRAGHPDTILQATPAVDAIVEVSRAPWATASQGMLDHRHLQRVRRRLRARGVYVLAIHLGWWPEGGAAHAAAAFASVFEHAQIWLPPTGADTLILVGSDAPLVAADLAAAAAGHRGMLSALGMPDESVLLSFAIGDGATAASWGADLGRAPSGWRLSAAVAERPALHLDALAERASALDTIWDLTGASLDPQTLEDRVAARRTFLRLLGQAARGNLGDVFAAARDLVEQEGDLATRSLAVLIAPHLAEARSSLDRARLEGRTSSGWEEAQRYASTARMLSPLSPEPPLLLGEIALQQGNLNTANDMFDAALRAEAGNLGALSGLARTAQARRDFEGALRWLREATTANGQDWQAWQNLGVQLWRLDRFGEAEDALRRASGLAGPTRPEPHVALAQLYLDTDRPTNALVHAERAVALGGGAPASFYRGRAHFLLGEIGRAEADFREAALAAPTDPLPRLGIAEIRLEQGELDAAADALRAVLAVAPDHVPARENLRRVEAAQRAAEARANPGAPLPPEP